MECRNVGTVDQIVRLVVAIILMIIGLFYLTEYLNILAILAGLLVLTSLFQFCLLYKLLGINTCEMKKVETVEQAKEKTIEGQTTKGKRVSTNYRKEETKTTKAAKKTKKTQTRAQTKTKSKSKSKNTKKKTKRR